MKVRYLGLIICGWLLALPTYAGISLSQAIVHFDADGKRSDDVEVFNQGDETVYVRVEPSLIHQPGTTQENREVFHDPKAAGLLVTPQRLVIAPGARKRVRFVRLDNTKETTTDKVFRVVIKPEVGEVNADQTALKVIVAYEVLVLAQPAKPQLQWQQRFVGNSLTLTNLGNTNVLLIKGVQCPEGQDNTQTENGCQEIGGKRLYAGNQWVFSLPFATPVTFQYSLGVDNHQVTFYPDTDSVQH